MFNILASNGKVEISEKYIFFNLTISNLEPLTNYTAFLVAGSVNPGYPDLMEDKKKVLI